MEKSLGAGVPKAQALPRARGKMGTLGQIRQQLEAGAPGVMEPELLLDLPLGVKIPVPPSAKPVFCRAKLGEKLQRPSGFYDLGDPYSRLLNVEYNSLHDPYLQGFHRRKENIQRLQRQGLVTSEGKVACTLKEFNDYRQYLTKLKLQTEHVARQEEERLRQRLAQWKDAQKGPGATHTSLGERLLQPRRPTCPPPPKTRKMSQKWRQCRRATADTKEGQTCFQFEPGQACAKLPERVSPEAGSDTSFTSVVTLRTKARSVVDSVLQRVSHSVPVLPPKEKTGEQLAKAPTQEGKETSLPEDGLPSIGLPSSFQPVPPAGPKPLAQRRRIAVRLRPITGTAQQPVLDTREVVGRLVDNVLMRWGSSEV